MKNKNNWSTWYTLQYFFCSIKPGWYLVKSFKTTKMLKKKMRKKMCYSYNSLFFEMLPTAIFSKMSRIRKEITMPK